MLTGIQEIDQADLAALYEFAVKNKGNILVFGPAGVGKTEMAMQVINACDKEFVYLNLSVLEAPDLMGLPVIDEEDKTTAYALPKMLPAKGSRKKPVVLLVDEADKAKPELQNPMLELFQFRSINGRPLDIDCVIATGNLPEEGAFSQIMSKALTNRCSVFKVRSAFEPWKEWAVSAGVNGLIVGFLSKHQEMLLQPSASGDDTAYCNPSPRSWALAAKDLDNASKASVEFQTLLVSGRVGIGAAVEFKVWLEHYRHIEPLIQKLVKEGVHPDTNDMSIDRILVCGLGAMNAVVSMCNNPPKADKQSAEFKKHIKKTHAAITNVMKWLKTLPTEYIVCAVKSTLSREIIRDYDLCKLPDFLEAFMKIRGAFKQN